MGTLLYVSWAVLAQNQNSEFLCLNLEALGVNTASKGDYLEAEISLEAGLLGRWLSGHQTGVGWRNCTGFDIRSVSVAMGTQGVPKRRQRMAMLESGTPIIEGMKISVVWQKPPPR